MQIDDQIVLVRRFMLRVAPVVARYSLDIEGRRRWSHQEEEDERLSEIARHNAQVTLQLAMHLAGTYAHFHDETQDTAPTPHPAPTSESKAPETAPGLQPTTEILPSPFPGVPSVQKRTKQPDTSYEGPRGNPFK